MPFDPQQAARDLNAKLRLEDTLRPQVRREQVALSREVVRSLDADGRLPDVSGIEAAALTPILRQHYDRVDRAFGTRISDQLPADVAATPEEKAATAAALALLFRSRAPTQANAIGETSARDARRAVRLANEESARLLAEGEPRMSLREEALFAGVIFSRALRGRTQGIICLETQAPAEAAKAQELLTLSGGAAAEHQWMTVGDSKVRRAPGTGHRGADSQIVQVGTAFLVGGQQLLHPGDQSLGATIDNVAGCRCNAVPDVTRLVTLRRRA